jgi:hypothetical protein
MNLRSHGGRASSCPVPPSLLPYPRCSVASRVEQQPADSGPSGKAEGQGSEGGRAGRGGGMGGRTGRGSPLQSVDENDLRGAKRTAGPPDAMTVTQVESEIVVEETPGQRRDLYPNGKTYKADEGATQIRTSWKDGKLVGLTPGICCDTPVCSGFVSRERVQFATGPASATRRLGSPARGSRTPRTRWPTRTRPYPMHTRRPQGRSQRNPRSSSAPQAGTLSSRSRPRSPPSA